ncbi:Hypothetical predicted protein [Mytilus galloprovincialis]|uniref:Uncharacterized protein n=1 Tax=Mytilus galloprovincialis TaxID=29158 RepID=A0A8B6BMK0_MYTGA|nr:Hypothetical predicted protein [Mytilus galloprovincialis]
MEEPAVDPPIQRRGKVMGTTEEEGEEEEQQGATREKRKRRVVVIDDEEDKQSPDDKRGSGVEAVGGESREPSRKRALHVKILDGKMQRAFKDGLGIDRGYVRIDVQMNSTCRDWMRSVRACFQPSPDLHPYISTSKGN